MTQHPHDEFDDVTPYPPGRAGAHRAPTEVPGAKRTGLPWIALLAVLALAVGGFSYFGLAGDDDDAEDTAQAQQNGDEAEEDAEDAEGSQDGTDEESPASKESPSPTEGEDGDESSDEGEDEESGSASDAESPVQVLNYQSSAESAQNAQAQLEDYGYNVVNVTEWTYQATEVPVVFHPSGQSELAEEIASHMGIERVVEDNRWSSVAVIVDESFAG